jgi:hypothetical protein
MEVRRTKRPFEKYIQQYVVVTLSNTTPMGNVAEITPEGYLILNPHQSSICNSQNGVTRIFVDKPQEIRISDIISVQPFNRENLEERMHHQDALDAIDLELKRLDLAGKRRTNERDSYEHLKFLEYLAGRQTFQDGSGI